jgi:hypothetical protein
MFGIKRFFSSGNSDSSKPPAYTPPQQPSRARPRFDPVSTSFLDERICFLPLISYVSAHFTDGQASIREKFAWTSHGTTSFL